LSIIDLFTQDSVALSERVSRGMQAFYTEKDDVAEFDQRQLLDKLSSLSIPEQPLSQDDYMDMVDETILPQCSHLASPTYLGHMTSPLPHFIPEIGRLIQTLNQNMVKMETSRGLTLLERQLLKIIHQQVYSFEESFYTPYLRDFSQTVGIFTSGGTMANITALWVAVKKARTHSPQVKKWMIVGSELMHYSFDKAAALLGVELVRLPVDEHNRLNLESLRQQCNACQQKDIGVACIVAIAGTTDFGSVDAIDQIASLAQDRHIHLHVDAAWGGAFMLSKDNRALLNHIEQADTITIDGHKQMLMPIGTGMLFFKNPIDSQVIRHTAPYAVRETSLDQGRFTIEGTRPANMLYLHACLHLIGKQGYNELFNKAMENIRCMARLIGDNPAFELLSAPTINILGYRYIPERYRGKTLSPQDNVVINDFNQRLQKIQRANGKSFVSRSKRKFANYDEQELVFLRVVILSPLVAEEHIRFVLQDQFTIAQELEKTID